jgi:hypothetical protein
MMNEAIHTSQRGLTQSLQKLHASVQRQVAAPLEPANLITTQNEATVVKAQMVALRETLEVQEHLLDLLA